MKVGYLSEQLFLAKRKETEQTKNIRVWTTKQTESFQKWNAKKISRIVRFWKPNKRRKHILNVIFLIYFELAEHLPAPKNTQGVVRTLSGTSEFGHSDQCLRTCKSGTSTLAIYRFFSFDKTYSQLQILKVTGSCKTRLAMKIFHLAKLSKVWKTKKTEEMEKIETKRNKT